MNAFRDFLLAEGSTRSAALMRIAIALLLWTRFAHELAPFERIAPHPWWLSISFFASTTGMLIGYRTRISTAWAGATLIAMVYGFGPEIYEPWRHHHTTLLAHATVLLGLTPCGQSYSVDRWLDPTLPERAPVWTTKLIAVQLTVLYLSTAVDKCNLPFLSGVRLQQTLQALYWGADPVTLPGWGPATAVLAIGAVALEFALPIGLWFRRAQPVLIPVGLLLHAVFYVVLPVGTFSLTTAVLYLAFLDPDAVHAALDRLQRAPD